MARSSDIDVTIASNGGYWQASWRDAKGKRHRKSLGAKAAISTRRARKLAREWAMTLSERPGMQYNHAAPTLGAWLDFYLAHRDELKLNTISVYKQTVAKLLDHFGEDVRIDRIDKVDAAAWHAGLPPNKATRAKHSRTAKTIFAYAVELDQIAVNPFASLRSNPPKTRRRWHYVSIEDFRLLVAACPSSAWGRYLALMRLAALRRGEALRLEWRDVDLARRVMHIRPEAEEGTKQRYRVVPIVPDLAALLADRSAGLVCAGVGPSNLDRDFKKIIDRAGLEPWAKLFHTMRQNCESDWQQDHPALDVAAWTGHSIEVAYRDYHQTSAERMARVTNAGATP